MVYDSRKAFHDYQEQKTFSSSHPSNLMNVLKDTPVEWLEPTHISAQLIRQMDSIARGSEMKTK